MSEVIADANHGCPLSADEKRILEELMRQKK
jgi:hypothetical protein